MSEFNQDFWLLAGGGGMLSGGSTFPDEPRTTRDGSIGGLTGGGGLMTSLFGGGFAAMRERVWRLRYVAEFNARYWRKYESKLRRIDIVIRIILGLGSTVGVTAWAVNSQLQLVSAVASAVCGILATVVLPAVSWNDVPASVQGVRHRWIDVVRLCSSCWSRVERDEVVSDKELDSIDEIVAEIDRVSFWFEDSQKFRVEAQQETRTALLVHGR